MKVADAPPLGPMLCFLGGGDLSTDSLLRQCDIFRANIPFISERVCLGGEFALYAMETYLGVKTGLDVPPYVRATYKEFFASIVATGAQVYFPIDVVCTLTEQPPPPPPPEPVEGQEPVEAPPPPEPLPEQITVDLRPALRRAVATLPEDGPMLDVSKGWLRLVTPEARAASVE